MNNHTKKCVSSHEFQKICSGYVRQHVHVCQSSLVESLLNLASSGNIDGDLSEAFSIDMIENCYPVVPEDGTLKELRDFIYEYSSDFPSDDPWQMDRKELIEYIKDNDEDYFDDVVTPAAFTDGELMDKVIELVEALRGDEWLDKARECATENPREIFEWWVVSSDLIYHLRKQGDEPILDNDYGTWWGRCTSGQSISIDGVIERIVSDLYDVTVQEGANRG